MNITKNLVAAAVNSIYPQFFTIYYYSTTYLKNTEQMFYENEKTKRIKTQTFQLLKKKQKKKTPKFHTLKKTKRTLFATCYFQRAASVPHVSVLK